MQGFSNSLLGLYDMFVGGFFSQASIFALGIMPYISASIIIQLLGAVVPYFQRLQKEGELREEKNNTVDQIWYRNYSFIAVNWCICLLV